MPLIVLLVALWLLRQFGLDSWWNPKSWWDDGEKAVLKAINDVKQWTLNIVRSAADLVENDVVDTFNWATEVWNDAWGWVQNAEQAARSLASSVYNDAASWVRSAENAANSLFNTVYADAKAWVHDAISDAENLYNKIYSEASGWVKSAISDAESLYNKIYSEASSWVKDVENIAAQGLSDLEKWASEAISAAYNAVYAAVKHDFIDPIETVLGVVEQAWDWITWFAEHPFQVLHDLETDVIDWTAHLPDEVETILASQQAADGFDIIGQIFGG